MNEEIQKLMLCFPGSVITSSGDLILEKKGNVSFSVKAEMTREDVICKILEWCSRDCAKAEPYKDSKRNSEWRDSLILKFNRYMRTFFNQSDFYWIYDRLGNAVSHERTLRFIRNGFDIKKLVEDA